jgi:tryptophan-rich sensory protein
MSSLHAILISVGVCSVAAALEGICAGNNVKSYFAGLKSPAYSPPLWFWYIIGGVYYTTFGFVLYRILRHRSNSALTNVALGVVLAMLLANALWNYVFFRARNLRFALVLAFVAPLMDLVLLVCLTRLDGPAAWALIPYLIYRLYSVWWAFGVWKMNPTPA